MKVDFEGVLDYIFYDSQKHELEQILEINEELYRSENNGLPNSIHGSDHIPLMA